MSCVKILKHINFHKKFNNDLQNVSETYYLAASDVHISNIKQLTISCFILL